MLEHLSIAPPDPILGLSEAFARDPRPEKINLSVGVYQDEHGKTPILECVKRAEARLLEQEQSKSYLAIDGLAEFRRLVPRLVLGHVVDRECTATVQTPGGTAALRIAAELIGQHFPGARVWCSQPTWANHPKVFQAAGLPVEYYSYAGAGGTHLDFEAMLGSLQKAHRGDVICLHACCHNPTGLDLSPGQWRQVAQCLKERQLLPLVDFAYQGFGDGLLEDTVGIRELVRADLEMLICSSFSKNFGLYGERVGALTVVARTPAATAAALSQVKALVRANYSNPPKHGGAIVATVLGDEELTALWENEVTHMRQRIQQMRQLFVSTLQAKGVKHDFSFLLQQRGMFSYSGLTPLQVDELRTRYAVYIVGSGRINVAGMSAATMDRLCSAIAAVLAG